MGPADVWVAGESNSVFHFNGSSWKTTDSGAPGEFVTGIWGSSTTDVWLVGSNGTLLHLE
jgi:hypothetical protein